MASPERREFPLSVSQELLLRQQGRPDPADHRPEHVTGGWRLVGNLDQAALSAALNGVIRRHEILRTRFVSHAHGSPSQQVVDDVRVPVAWAGDNWREAIDRSTLQPFDLSRPPLFRLVVAHLGDGGHGLFFAMHHIITDRWSMDVLAHDLYELYSAAVAGRDSRLPGLAVQYGDYASWQRRYTDSTAAAPQIDHLKRALAGHERLRLPAPGPRPATAATARGKTGGQVRIELSAESTAAMTAMAWRTRASQVIVVTAALGAALNASTGQTDVAIGAIVSDRPRPELHHLMGPFFNVVALRMNLPRDELLTFRELVRRTRDAWLAAYANQDAPFHRVAAQAPGEPCRGPVFDVVVNHGGGWPEAGRHAAMPPPWDPQTPATGTFELSLCGLMINTLMIGDRLSIAFVYDSSRYDHASMASLSTCYRETLQRGVAAPDQVLRA